MDSEPKDGAEWASFMATPPNLHTVRESHTTTFNTNTTSTTTDEELECPTSDESVQALRHMLGKPGMKKPSSRRSLRGNKVHYKHVTLFFNDFFFLNSLL